MASRPYIALYFGDWRKNQKLRFCSWAARGVWLETMGLMHDSPEYGVLRQPLKRIAEALGAPLKLLNELVQQGVMYGCEKGECEPLIYRPKTGRREGDPVTLVKAQPGPIWYSPRMVRDEYVRIARGKGDDFDVPPKLSPKPPFGAAHKTTPNTSPSSRSISISVSEKIGRTEASEQGEEDAGGRSSLAGVQNGDFSTDLTPGTASHFGTLAAIRLRQMGMRVQAMHPTLLALGEQGFTIDELASVAAEKVLADAPPQLIAGAPDDLLERYALIGLRLVPDEAKQGLLRDIAIQIPINYLAGVLRGRRRDAEKLSHGSNSRPAGNARETLAERAERERREADARDAERDDDDADVAA